jgi:hypothetical protein
MEVAVPPETIWMVSVMSLGGEESQVPILDHIPPEGIAGVDEREDEPIWG